MSGLKFKLKKLEDFQIYKRALVYNDFFVPKLILLYACNVLPDGNS